MRDQGQQAIFGNEGVVRNVLNVFGLPLSPVNSLDRAFDLVAESAKRPRERACLMTFVNPLAVKLVRSAGGYGDMLRRMDAVFCDGIGLAVAARWFGGFPLERISFDSTSLAPRVFAFAREHGQSIVLVGGKPGVAEIAAERIGEVFPGIRILAALDGFQPAETLVETVTGLAPDVVISGMGAPRQEAFLLSLADAGWRGVGFTCGGYLDHLGDRFDFYPAIVDRLKSALALSDRLRTEAVGLSLPG